MRGACGTEDGRQDEPGGQAKARLQERKAEGDPEHVGGGRAIGSIGYRERTTGEVNPVRDIGGSRSVVPDVLEEVTDLDERKTERGEEKEAAGGEA